MLTRGDETAGAAATVDGLWTIEVDAVSGWSVGGVVVFRAGRLAGGGDHYWCVGEYAVHGRKVTGWARCVHYHGPVFTAFGTTMPDFRVAFSCAHRGDALDGEIHQSDRPETRLPFHLLRRAGC